MYDSMLAFIAGTGLLGPAQTWWWCHMSYCMSGTTHA
jgi:hypothetical protein